MHSVPVIANVIKLSKALAEVPREGREGVDISKRG
jgi:hypothetical protein